MLVDIDGNNTVKSYLLWSFKPITLSTLQPSPSLSASGDVSGLSFPVVQNPFVEGDPEYNFSSFL